MDSQKNKYESSQRTDAGKQSSEFQEHAITSIDHDLDAFEITSTTQGEATTLQNSIQAQGENDDTNDINDQVSEAIEAQGDPNSTQTFELLNGTETKSRLLNIIKSDSFKTLIPQGQIDTPERRLDILFQRINGLVGKYIERQFNLSPEQMEACPVLKKSLIPAIEWYLLDMLKGEADANGETGGNDANNAALDLFNNAKFNDIKGIWETISQFSKGSKFLYGKIKNLQRAIDFLVIHKDILGHADQYVELANPYQCMTKFLSNPLWGDAKTDNLFPHPSDPNNPNSSLVEITPKDVGLTLKKETQEIGMTDDEKTALIENIGNIQVVENERTTKNIVKALATAEQFMSTTNTLKDRVIQTLQNLNEPLNLLSQFGIGLESIPTDGFFGGVMNFFLSAMGIPGGLEGIQRERALANGTYQTPETFDDSTDDYSGNGGTTEDGKNGADDDETQDNDTESLSETGLLKKSQKNLSNFKKALNKMKEDYKDTLSKETKKIISRCVDDIEELEDEDFSLSAFQDHFDTLITNLKSDINTKFPYSDEMKTKLFAYLEPIEKENTSIREKMGNLEKGTQGSTSSRNRESYAQGTGLEAYKEGGKLLFDDFSKIEESERSPFKEKILEVANNLEINPNWLILLLKRISDLDPKGESKYGFGKGLFGISDTICKEKWNLSAEEFAKKNPSEQVEKFGEFFQSFKGKIKSYQDLVLMNFAPGSFDKTKNNDTILYTNLGSQNPSGYDKNTNGEITVGEVKEYETQFIKDKVPDDMKKQFLNL